MKDNQLDRLIKDKLESLQPPQRPGSWDAFEQRLDAEDTGVPEPENSVVDEMLFQKLHQLEVPYDKSTWTEMEERLDREFVRPEYILRYKAMELVMLFLVMLTFWQLLPFPAGPQQPIAQNDDADTTLSVAGPSAASEASSPKPTEAPADSEAMQSAARTEIADANGDDLSAASTPVTAPEISADDNSSSGVPSAPLFADRESIAPMQPLTSIRQQLALQQSKSNPLRNELWKPHADDLMLPPSEAGLLAHLPSQRPGLVHPPEDNHFPGTVRPGTPGKYFFFGMFGSLDYNRIVTPADRFLDVNTTEFDRYELGYSGGFSLGFGVGRWEIQTGAIYTAKQYQSLNLILQHGNTDEGYTKEQLKDIQLNILHLPLNFRYDLFQYDKWRIYGMAGASLQVATQANYFVHSEGNRRSSLLSPYIKNGWFEGGTFFQNSFLTGNVGFGVEHYVTTRWSWFAQPTYQHTFHFFDSGFGPFNDRLHTMSIYTGIRIRMKR